MAAFNFPDPTVQQTVTNPITGSTYQWKEPPGKWVITTKVRAVTEIIYEGDTPPTPRGDYKLWYSTDTLELYFWYEDVNGNGAWVPTAAPITALEELTAFAAQAEVDIDQLQYKQQLLQVALDDIYLNQQQQQGDYVSKVGGDEMQGPFKVLTNPDIPGSRDSRRIETYGVFSGSDSTALRFGTTRDRIYVGHDDTSFNGLVKIDRIAEKNAGNSVKFENDIKMGVHQIKNLAEATDDKDAVTYGQVKQELSELATPVDIKAIQVAGLQLGHFRYRRSSDSFVSGSIHSNTTTDPKNITQLDIWHTNIDGTNFGKDFYGMYIVPKMFVHIRDNGAGKYVGRITTVDSDALSNGVRLTLEPLDALTEGTVYYNNQYDVSIGYSRYIK